MNSLILCTAFTILYIITPLLKRLSYKLNILDQPNSRKSHSTPIPLLGGLALYLGFWTTVLLSVSITPPLLGIFLGSTLIIVLGVVDDVFHLSPVTKLIGQGISAIIPLFFGISIQFLSNPVGGYFYLNWLTIPITIFWIVGMINIVNLIDGLDGLAAGVVGISSFVLMIVAFQTGQTEAGIILMILMGVCLGFLKYNFAPAQIFMGDSGAMFLGYMLGTISIMGVLKGAMTVSFIIPILALGIPVSDTIFTIVRRYKNKKKIFSPDDGHLHHRLLRLGLSTKQVVFLCYVLTGVLSLFAWLVSVFSLTQVFIMFGVVAVLVSLCIVLFKKAPSKFVSFLSVLF